MFEVTLNTQGNEGSLKEGELHPSVSAWRSWKSNVTWEKKMLSSWRGQKNLDTGLLFVYLSFRDKLRLRKMCVSVCLYVCEWDWVRVRECVCEWDRVCEGVR